MQLNHQTQDHNHFLTEHSASTCIIYTHRKDGIPYTIELFIPFIYELRNRKKLPIP